ncbi:MAG TPA: DUF552 domain-containing protein [Euryarchaeota archaeon]|nr:DUF552 domain-containing protein [Euryarchaeota archaeon]HIQ09973.1 DUF552 domain-containing protein [Euryarchaeota archaeon]
MGFLDKIFGGGRDEPDIEELLNSLGDEDEVVEEEAERYVRPLALNSVQDYDKVMAEINKNNIVLLNIRPLATKNAVGLKDVISRIKESVLGMGGDIARITEFYVLITPPGIKIVKRRSQ